MKKLLILILILQAGFALSQPVVVDWQRGYGGHFREAEPSLIKVNSNKYIIVCPSNSRNDGDRTVDRCDTTNTYFDSWMFCIDSSANILWQQRHGGEINDGLHLALQASDGGFLLTGNSQSEISCEKSQNTFAGTFDYWIVKTDSAGNKVWDKRHGGSNGDEGAITAFETADGGFIVAGKSDSQLSGNVTDSCHGANDVWIIKIDSAGTKLWDNMYGAYKNEYFHNMIQGTSDGYYFTSFLTQGTYPDGDISQAGHGDDDAWLVKCDSVGAIIWDVIIGGDDLELFQKLFFSYSGHLLALGALDSLSDGWNICDTLVRGRFDCYISIIDTSTGITLCDKRFGGDHTDEIFNIAETSDGGYIIAANSKSGISYEKTESNRGLLDYWIIKVDSALNIQWDKTFGGSNDDRIAGVVEVTPGSYIAYGSSKSPISGDKEVPLWGGSVPSWMEDIWVIKFHEDSTTSINENNAGSWFNVYPNPAESSITISSLFSPGNSEFTLHDLSGREVLRKEFTRQIIMPVNHLAPGMYIYTVTGSNGKTEKGKLVKQQVGY